VTFYLNILLIHRQTRRIKLSKGGNTMKKLLIILTLLIGCGMAAYFFLFNTIIPVRNINSLEISSGTETPIVLYNTDDGDLSKYAKTINAGKSSSKPFSFKPEYSINFTYGDHEPVALELDFDLDKEAITVYEVLSDRYYEIDKEASLAYFLDPNFKDIYPVSKTPRGILTYETEVVEPRSRNHHWQYKQIDEEWGAYDKAYGALDHPHFDLSASNKAFALTYDIEPTSTLLQVLDDETVVYETSVQNGRFMPYLTEGDYTYVLTCDWATDNYRGQEILTYSISLDLPARFRLSKETATAGDFITLFADYVNPDETIVIDQNLVTWTPSFFDNKGTKMAFIPLNYWAKTGDYEIKLYTVDENEEQSSHTSEFDVKIKYKNFKKQYLYVDKTVEASTRNDEAYAQYNKYFKPTRDVITPEKLWDGPFITPVEGRISTEFGEMRYVNDALTSYRHSGTDYAVPRGTPVKAPNSGRVNLSMFLTLTGNTVVIDHGLGLFSVYFHMDSLAVAKGQMVEQGDVLGTVGSTGFSTGPHLHYTTSIGKVNFDSLLLTDMDPASPQ